MRVCLKCKTSKQVKAFIGARIVCRVCWHYLSEDDQKTERYYAKKNKYKINQKERKEFNPS